LFAVAAGAAADSVIFKNMRSNFCFVLPELFGGQEFLDLLNSESYISINIKVFYQLKWI